MDNQIAPTNDGNDVRMPPSPLGPRTEVRGITASDLTVICAGIVQGPSGMTHRGLAEEGAMSSVGAVFLPAKILFVRGADFNSCIGTVTVSTTFTLPTGKPNFIKVSYWRVLSFQEDVTPDLWSAIARCRSESLRFNSTNSWLEASSQYSVGPHKSQNFCRTLAG